MTTSTATISPVHGGLSAPVNRIDAGATLDTSLTRVEVNEVDVNVDVDVYVDAEVDVDVNVNVDVSFVHFDFLITSNDCGM